jgi:hypothetical protein
LAFLGAVPLSILYDNTKLAVAKILGHGRRQRTRVFSELQSHYLFEDRFGRPGKGNDKGHVEGLVGFSRRHFLVPIPAFDDFDQLNAHLEVCCLERLNDIVRGDERSIGERLVEDLSAMAALPTSVYEACDKQAREVSSLALVRYRDVDYSVPTAYAYRSVLVRGYVHEVVISYRDEIIARHRRSYQREDRVFDPLHYLSLLERKPRALDQAAPLQQWNLPDVFPTLRRLLEARLGTPGKREYIQVLRLLESFKLTLVEQAIADALRLGAISYDAVKHLCLCRLEQRPPKLDLALYPYLPRTHVQTTSAKAYLRLIQGGAA